MGHAVSVYAVIALLAAASAGPVLATVRDASLVEFESLDDPRTLDDFPLLRNVEPYLPPIVVDWLIIRPDPDLDLPEEVGYRVDEQGRVILVWPDGCEETQEQFREDSRCDEDPAPDCRAQPLHPECVDSGCPEEGDSGACPPVEDCPQGSVLQDGECIPDPECDPDGDPAHPDACEEEEDDEEDPPCPAGTVPAYTGECVATVTRLVEHVAFDSTASDNRSFQVELTTHYRNLSLEIDREGWPLRVGWEVTLWHDEAGREFCWVPENDPQASSDCAPGEDNSAEGDRRSYVDDNDLDPIPPGNLTLTVEYNPSAVTTSPQLDVRLFGRPTAP